MRLHSCGIAAFSLIVILTCGYYSSVQAHALAPVLLTVELSSDTELRAVWSFSRDFGAVDPKSLGLGFAQDCSPSGAPVITAADLRWIRQEQYSCQGGVKSLRLNIEGLEQFETSVALRIIDLSGEEQIYMLDKDASVLVLEAGKQSRTFNYLQLGVEHIIGGLDHLLFIIALFFLANGELRRIFWLITAFTLAHSLTLSAAALGWVYLPQHPVEALIALSIALVAADLVGKQGQCVKSIKTYWPIVFVFGLLHGLGFAAALSEIGLPENSMISALLAFNLGIEFGQLAALFICGVLVDLICRTIQRGLLQRITGYCIGSIAGIWFIERAIWTSL